MLDLLRALDAELPNGSEVTLFNMRVNDAVICEHPLVTFSQGLTNSSCGSAVI